MSPTRWVNLLGLALLTGALGWLLADRAYGELVRLPGYAPVTATLIALFELGLARVVSQKVRGRSLGRPMHPLQVARAVVLAKASSVTGALLLGFYAGFFTWAFSHREINAAEHDALVSGLSAASALLLVVGALLLERACRTPPPPD